MAQLLGGEEGGAGEDEEDEDNGEDEDEEDDEDEDEDNEDKRQRRRSRRRRGQQEQLRRAASDILDVSVRRDELHASREPTLKHYERINRGPTVERTTTGMSLFRSGPRPRFDTYRKARKYLGVGGTVYRPSGEPISMGSSSSSSSGGGGGVSGGGGSGSGNGNAGAAGQALGAALAGSKAEFGRKMAARRILEAKRAAPGGKPAWKPQNPGRRGTNLPPQDVFGCRTDLQLGALPAGQPHRTTLGGPALLRGQVSPTRLGYGAGGMMGGGGGGGGAVGSPGGGDDRFQARGILRLVDGQFEG